MKKNELYIVQKGDTLWSIAEKYYGSGLDWHKVYNNNFKTIGEDYNRIYPGQILNINYSTFEKILSLIKKD